MKLVSQYFLSNITRVNQVKSNFVELVLTCGSWQEAQAIADELLAKKLVASVEFLGQHERDGVKLVMQSVEHLFEKIENEVKLLQSHDISVLQQIPLTNVSSEAQAWLERETMV